MNIGLFQPKKDQDEYDQHIQRKTLVRKEKEMDKQLSFTDNSV